MHACHVWLASGRFLQGGWAAERAEELRPLSTRSCVSHAHTNAQSGRYDRPKSQCPPACGSTRLWEGECSKALPGDART
eukprot:2189748-Pyramimonas_sp.AAC.1